MRRFALDTPALPGTDELAATNLALPISPVLGEAEAQAVVSAVAVATAAAR
jgi:dTDP-4-amino-4,6-dideoxygalactose transaminase